MVVEMNNKCGRLIWERDVESEKYFDGNSRRNDYSDGKMTWNIY